MVPPDPTPGPPAEPRRWLLLVHQVPAKPDYLRVKVRRRLDRLGAVPLKHSVYVLPYTAGTLEDFQWLLREIVAAGGEGSVCEATFVAGASDDTLVGAFHAARGADYAQIAADAAAVASAVVAVGDRGDGPASAPGAAALARVQQRLIDVVTIDHLGAPGRGAAEQAVAAAAARVAAAQQAITDAPASGESGVGSEVGGALRGRTWVTRAGVHVDRIASAWLIRRFLDPEARFRFVPAAEARAYRPAAGELRFDMFEAEYTHEGDRCTFETLLARFGLTDPALRALGEMVHDLDLKDAKYARAEAPGFGAVIDGIAATVPTDEARLAQGAALLDGLYAVLSRRTA